MAFDQGLDMLKNKNFPKILVLNLVFFITISCLSCKKALPEEMLSIDAVAYVYVDPICHWTYITINVNGRYILNNGPYKWGGSIDWGNGNTTPIWGNYFNHTDGNIVEFGQVIGSERFFPENPPKTYTIQIKFKSAWSLCDNLVITKTMTL